MRIVAMYFKEFFKEDKEPPGKSVRPIPFIKRVSPEKREDEISS